VHRSVSVFREQVFETHTVQIARTAECRADFSSLAPLAGNCRSGIGARIEVRNSSSEFRRDRKKSTANQARKPETGLTTQLY
jgi:hypothetical protein